MTDKLIERIQRFESFQPTNEDLEWALPILQRYYLKSRRLTDKNKHDPIEIDYNNIPVLIKEMGQIRQYLTKDLIILESFGVIVATYNKGQYYRVKRENKSRTTYRQELRQFRQHQAMIREGRVNGTINKLVGRPRKGSMPDIDDSFREPPKMNPPDWTTTIQQEEHILAFIGKNASKEFPIESFEKALTKINTSRAIIQIYAKRQSLLFWDKNNY